MTGHYKLLYFPVRGRAEAIRYILAYSGTHYEDVRIPKENWMEVKPTTPMGQLPVLEYNGKQICQSMTIARYLAKKFGLVPTDEWEAARVDMLVDGISDLIPNVRAVNMAIMSGDEAKKKEAWATFKAEHLPAFLDRYEKFLKENGTGYLVGSKITWVDIVLAELLDRFTTVFDTPSILHGHEHLNDLMKKIHEIPHIKKYVEHRQPTPL